MSGKRNGGQKGHKGETLKQVETPEVVVKYSPEFGKECGTSLIGIFPLEVKKSQEVDITKVVPIVTEYQAETKVCPKRGCHN